MVHDGAADSGVWPVAPKKQIAYPDVLLFLHTLDFASESRRRQGDGKRVPGGEAGYGLFSGREEV